MSKIRDLRKKLGLTQLDLATRVGAQQSIISKLERGDLRLTADWMQRLAPVLKCHPSDLLEEPIHIYPSAANDTINDKPAIEPQNMVTALEVLESYLQEHNLSMTPPKKAAAVILMCEITETEGSVKKSTLEKIAKLAAHNS